MYPITYNPDSMRVNHNHPWVYYLLGGGKEQLAVWHGREHWVANQCEAIPYGEVLLYPWEYNTYSGGLNRITTRPWGAKEYKIADHLGSVRVVLDQAGQPTQQMDYEPFGRAVTGMPIDRQSFIDKEKDQETVMGGMLSDFGVRKYDESDGRFMSIDPLWEKYRGWSPYNYSYNTPLTAKDPNGKFGLFTHRDITTEALKGVLPEDAVRTVANTTLTVDLKSVYYYESHLHMDNSDFERGWDFVNGAKNWDSYERLGGSLHALQDFYSHSNYVELATKYFGDESRVPTFDRAQQNKGFMEIWKEQGISGSYPDSKGGITHEMLNKDSADKPGFALARKLAVEHTRAFVAQWVRDRKGPQSHTAGGKTQFGQSAETPQ